MDTSYSSAILFLPEIFINMTSSQEQTKLILGALLIPVALLIFILCISKIESK